MGIGQGLATAIFWASIALHPVALMPARLQIAAHLDPLTHAVDGLRGVILLGGASVYGAGRRGTVQPLVALLMSAVGLRRL